LTIQFLPGGAAKSFTPLTGAPTPFHAPLFVLSTVLPFVDFGYSRWVPNGAAQWITVISVVLGWALATAVVAAFAGILHRGD
jgi:protein-S-isoprenylcysteine O-methyltransferase Ste14